jgi:hypothetical protein
MGLDVERTLRLDFRFLSPVEIHGMLLDVEDTLRPDVPELSQGEAEWKFIDASG